MLDEDNDILGHYHREHFYDIGIEYELLNTPEELSQDSVWLYEMWGDFFIDGKAYNNHVLLFSGCGVFHYFGENPYDHGLKPLTIASFSAREGTLYGKSLVEDVSSISITINAFVNSVLNVMNMASVPANLYNTSDKALQEFIKVHSDNNLALKPGQNIPSDNPGNALAPYKIDTSILGKTDDMIKYLQDLFRESTGSVPYATGGVSSGSDKTLGEVEILSGSAATRLGMSLDLYQQNRLEDYLNMYISNDRQFIADDSYLFDMVDDMDLTAELVRGLKVYGVVTGVNANAATRNNMNEIVGLIGQILPLAKELPNIVQLKQGEVSEVSIPALIRAYINSSSSLGEADIVSMKSSSDQLTPEQALAPQTPLPGAPVGDPMNGAGLPTQLDPSMLQ
jgi:hypothetical protein